MGSGSQSRVPAGHGRAVRGHMKEERRQRLNGGGGGIPEKIPEKNGDAQADILGLRAL